MARHDQGHTDAREELVRLLDERAFRPVLRAQEEEYPREAHDKLRHVKEATQRERERFQNYESAQKVYRMYRDDLNSEEAQQIDQELRELELPTLADCRSEFEQAADRLGVH